MLIIRGSIMVNPINKLLLTNDALVKQQWQQEKSRQKDKIHTYVYFESSESDGSTLSTTTRSRSGSPLDEKVSDIIRKNMIVQKPKGKKILKKRASCTFL